MDQIESPEIRLARLKKMITERTFQQPPEGLKVDPSAYEHLLKLPEQTPSLPKKPPVPSFNEEDHNIENVASKSLPMMGGQLAQNDIGTKADTSKFPMMAKKIEPRTVIKTQGIDKDKQSFLGSVGQIESSGGKNTNHPWMESGMHKGNRAIGTYGFMPNTIKDLANKTEDPSIKNLAEMDQFGMEKAIKANPSLEKKLADVMYNHLNERYAGDKDKMMYAWQQGHYTPSESIDQDTLDRSDRIAKYHGMQNRMTAKR